MMVILILNSMQDWRQKQLTIEHNEVQINIHNLQQVVQQEIIVIEMLVLVLLICLKKLEVICRK